MAHDQAQQLIEMSDALEDGTEATNKLMAANKQLLEANDNLMLSSTRLAAADTELKQQCLLVAARAQRSQLSEGRQP